jgi:hypothetical protein
MNRTSDRGRVARNPTWLGAILAKAQERWQRSEVTSSTKVFTLILVAFAASQFVGLSLQGLRFLISSPNKPVGLSNLDSFSPPSVATAIVNQEADRLLLLYTEKFPSQATRASDSAPYLSPAVGFRESPEIAKRCSGDRARDLVEIHEAVRRLSTDLDRKFLMVYFREDSWNDFLDSYLRLLLTEPAIPDVVGWEWCALRCSQRCGRTDELVDALEHAVRFHPELKTRHGLRSVLDDWRACNASNLNSPINQGD